MKSDNSSNTNQFLIKFQPIGRKVQIKETSSILEAAQFAGIDITSICGGVGVCDSCRIRLVSGELTSLTSEEQATFNPDEIKQGLRLACQAYPRSDVVIDIPPDSLTAPQRLQVESQKQEMLIDPVISIKEVVIPPPSIEDLRSDLERFRDSIEPSERTFEIEYPVLTSLSNILRESQWNIRAVFSADKLIHVLPSQATTPLLGLAVDIGTTKVAAYLVDIETGVVMAQAGAMNPQIAFGEDVISRISYVIHHDEDKKSSGLRLLQTRIVEGLNDLVTKTLDELNDPRITNQNIVEAVIVGNTAMHHLFAGLPVTQLGLSPYVPAVSEALYLPARELGLAISPSAYIYLPPNIAGYVGADHIAMLVSTLYQYNHELAYTNKNIIALDIGTNTEISLLHNKHIYSCSTASGPAFEGAHIQFGMRAAPGAIEKVQISSDGILHYKTISDQSPVGVCGSGILDAIAEMYYNGILDEKGSLNRNHPKVRYINNHSEFELVPASHSGHGQAIVITRRDINEIQLAKGAIRTGIELLLQEAGITHHDLDEFIVAGAFGTYIDLRNSIRIGMFPEIPLDICKQVGNAAGAGARQLLLSKTYRKIAENIARDITYLELSNHPKFSQEFSRSLFFPKIVIS